MISRRAAGNSADQRTSNCGGGSQAGNGSGKRPVTRSRQSSNSGPNREESSRRGKACNCPTRQMPRLCSRAMIGSGRRRAGSGREEREETEGEKGRKGEGEMHLLPFSLLLPFSPSLPPYAASAQAAPRRIGHGGAKLPAFRLQLADDPLQQRRFAAEQIGHPRDVQEHALGKGVRIDAHQGRELPAAPATACRSRLETDCVVNA